MCNKTSFKLRLSNLNVIRISVTRPIADYWINISIEYSYYKINHHFRARQILEQKVYLFID